MIGCVVASRDGERVLRTIGDCNLHLLLVLQVDGCTFLTGEIQFVERYLCLACRLEHELSVIALTCQKDGEFVAGVFAVNVYIGTIHCDSHTVFSLLIHFGCGTIITDGDVFCLAHTSHQKGECPYKYLLHI